MTETCANCGHDKGRHDHSGYGLCHQCRNQGSSRIHPCKKFVPQNQSPQTKSLNSRSQTSANTVNVVREPKTADTQSQDKIVQDEGASGLSASPDALRGSDDEILEKKKSFVRQLDFRPAFVWEQEIEDFVKERMKGYTLNVPCGSSKLGDVRLDLDPNLSMRGAYDFFKDELNYPDNTFDTIISDPPWKVGHYFRPKLFFKLVEKCKIGGQIIYNATWIPTSKFVKLKECWIRQSSQFSNVSIISVFEKIADVPEKALKKEVEKK